MKKTNLKYELKLNIKSIVAYEKLTQQSFADFDTSLEKIIPLLYCIIVCNNDYKETYADTVKYLFSNINTLNDLSNKLDKELKFQSQFQSIGKLNNVEESVEENKEPKQESNKVYITQLIPILIKDCNLDINYVMEDMSYSDIDLFIKYKDLKERNELEEKRLFTYLSILPHIDSKKCSLQQLLPFSWEEEERRKKGLEEIKKNEKKFYSFLNNNNINTNTDK